MNRRNILAVGVFVALASVILTTRSDPARAGSTMVIYDDAFRNGFVHNRWNGRNNISNTAPVKVGAFSISTTPMPWTGILIDIPDRLPLRNMTKLRFWVNGGADGLDAFSVTAMTSVNRPQRSAAVPHIAPRTWVSVEIPLAKLVRDTSAFDQAPRRSLWFTSSDKVERAPIYLDQIELVGNGEVGTTTTTSPTGTTESTSSTTTTAPTTTTTTPTTSTTAATTTTTTATPPTTTTTAATTTTTAPTTTTTAPQTDPGNCPANFACDDFLWQGAHAASINGGAGRTVWWNTDMWDASHDAEYDSQDSYAHIDVHKAASAALSDGRVDNATAITGGAPNTAGQGVMHIHETAIASARLRTPILVSASNPGVVRFRASRYVTDGHWWELALTPDIVGAELTAVPGLSNLMASPLRSVAPDHSGPGHPNPVDSVNVVASGWPDDCSGGTYFAVRSSRNGVTTDSVNQVDSVSQLRKVFPSEREHLYAWQLRIWPDRVEIAVDLDENGTYETVERFSAVVPWGSVYVHLMAVAYHAQAHPQGSCNQGQDREFIWRQVQAGPVASGTTQTFPRAVGTDNVPRRTGWMLTDFRDVQRFGQVAGLDQPNPAHYTNYGPVLLCNTATQLAAFFCPKKAATSALSVDLPAGSISGARSARFVFDTVRASQEGTARLSINGQAVGVLPPASTARSVERDQWSRRSIDVPVSLLRAGPNTITLELTGDVRLDRLQLEVTR